MAPPTDCGETEKEKSPPLCDDAVSLSVVCENEAGLSEMVRSTLETVNLPPAAHAEGARRRASAIETTGRRILAFVDAATKVVDARQKPVRSRSVLTPQAQLPTYIAAHDGDGGMASAFHDNLVEGVSFTRVHVDSSLAWAAKASRTAVKLVAWGWGTCVVLGGIVAWTVVLYLLAYWLVMPVMTYEADLFFDFDPLGNGPAFAPSELPRATVALAHADQQWTAWVKDKPVPPRYAVQRLPLPVESYNVYVELSLPETAGNLDLGVFMVDVRLAHVHARNASSVPLAQSRRPVVIPFRTTASRLVRDVVFIPLRALGLLRPVHVARVLVMEGFVPHADARRSPSLASVTLSHPGVVVESARLCFEVQLHGVRYFMRQWPLLSFVLFVTLGIALQLTALFSLIVQRVLGTDAGFGDAANVPDAVSEAMAEAAAVASESDAD